MRRIQIAQPDENKSTARDDVRAGRTMGVCRVCSTVGAVIQVVESSSPFSALDRDAARAETMMGGDPIYLSVGRLDEIKDPCTMLRGFERISEVQPDARLYMYFQSGDLLDEIRSFIASRPSLRESCRIARSSASRIKWRRSTLPLISCCRRVCGSGVDWQSSNHFRVGAYRSFPISRRFGC